MGVSLVEVPEAPPLCVGLVTVPLSARVVWGFARTTEGKVSVCSGPRLLVGRPGEGSQDSLSRGRTESGVRSHPSCQ